MSDLSLYLARATEYCAETRNLIEDVIVGVQHHDYMSEYMKMRLLQYQLKGMGFSDEQLEAFAKGEIPSENKIIPVEVTVKRNYTVYVHASLAASGREVRQAAIKQVVKNPPKDCDLTPDYPLEESDITEAYIRWDGAEFE